MRRAASWWSMSIRKIRDQASIAACGSPPSSAACPSSRSWRMRRSLSESAKAAVSAI